MTFKNSNTKRNSECTTIRFCQSDAAPNANWTPCDESEIAASGASQLWIETVGRGVGVEPLRVAYFGWL